MTAARASSRWWRRWMLPPRGSTPRRYSVARPRPAWGRRTTSCVIACGEARWPRSRNSSRTAQITRSLERRSALGPHCTSPVGAARSRRCLSCGSSLNKGMWRGECNWWACVDKEVVEQILLQAKKDGKTNDIITAKDKLDGKTPIELAKERQAELLAIAAAASAAGDGEEKNELDEKRKYDQIVQMLEKGVDAA
eukprot:scaffold21556_cov120-Isochrysis_galbana.AAC.3